MAVGDGVVNTGGIELWLTNSSGVLTKLAGFLNCNHPKPKVSEAETTDQDSDGFKGYKTAMKEMAHLKARLKYEPGSPTDQLIFEHLVSGQDRPFKLVEPKEDGTKAETIGYIHLLDYEPDEGTLGEVRKATLTGRPTPLTQASAS